MPTYKKRLTNELREAIDIVCGACPYIVDESDNAEAKYCERCMVRLMTNLFSTEDELGEYLPTTSPEWQAIINY